jgi:hypothetical protein
MGMHTRENWIGGAFGLFVVLPYVCSIGIGALIIGWQCLMWLRTATWNGITLRDGLVWWAGPTMRYYFPDTGALGLDKILAWGLDSSPLALWFIVIPLIWFNLGFLLFNLLLVRRG